MSLLLEPKRNSRATVSLSGPDVPPLKWGWACRSLSPGRDYCLVADGGEPQVGDVAVARVESIGHHTKLVTAQHEDLRLYRGDHLIGVFGNRYATAAFEAEVLGTEELHVLTNAGMIGTVRSRHQDAKPPTSLSFLGYLADTSGHRLNLKELLFQPTLPSPPPRNVVLVVGTSMNSGKTTAAAKLVQNLVHRGLRVAAYKLTGSVSPRDTLEWRATGAADVRDFSDYGFPSTYRCTPQELVALFHTMLADAARTHPDIVVMEIADGVLQRETMALLEDTAVRRHVRGIVLTATCALSALFGLAELQARGHEVLVVSGLMTSSPLFVREFANRSPIPVGCSTGSGNELADLVTRQLPLDKAGP